MCARGGAAGRGEATAVCGSHLSWPSASADGLKRPPHPSSLRSDTLSIASDREGKGRGKEWLLKSVAVLPLGSQQVVLPSV